MDLLNLISIPFIAVDENYNVVWMNKKAKELYPSGFEKCYQMTHDTPEPCYFQAEHPCPIKEMKERGIDHYSVVHRHLVKGKESFVLVKAEYNPDYKLFIEFQMPLDELLTALEVGKLRPEVLINSGPLTFFIWENREGWPVNEVSKSVYELTEYSQDEFLKGFVSYAQLIHPEDMPRVLEEVRINTENRSDYWTHQPYRIITKSGKIKWVLDHTVSVKDSHGNVVGYYGYVMDISEYYEKERLFRILAENNPSGVVLYNFKEDRIVFVNRALLNMLKYDESELIGQSGLKFVHPEDLNKASYVIGRRMSGYSGTVEKTCRLITKSGKTRWVKFISQAVSFKNRDLCLITIIDLTKEKLREKKLFRLATTDRLTTLFNRHAGNKLFENLIHQAERYGSVFSILLLDIDNFKEINDKLGHLAGDRVLSCVGRTIKKSLRRSDVPIRWGGEEFLILLPHTKNPLLVAEKIRERVSSLVCDNCGPITVSIGCTVYTKGDIIDSMIQRADLALYKVKSMGKNRVEMA
ncbi:sensor domain-containing diguanylate cyclase [Thermocrinis sp.]